MEKLTSNEIALTKIVRATFLNDKWVVLVSDADNNIYNVSFTGLESDNDDTILSNTHAALLEVDKYVAPVLPVTINRENIIGLTPKL
jgi:hypothetical protein